MKTNSHTDKLFEQMRTMPPEIPVEQVEQFVLAQTAIGITAAAASKGFFGKGIFTKAFIKFHLNTILIMTSTITASLVSLFVWNGHQHHAIAQNNSVKNFKPEYSATLTTPKIAEADTPKVTTVQTTQDGEAVSVTTIQTESGTNIKVVTNGNEQTKIYYNTPADSSYTYAYATPGPGEAVAATGNNMTIAAIDQKLVMPDMQKAMLEAQAAMMQMNSEMALAQQEAERAISCTKMSCPYDSLIPKLEKAMLKDGLIADTLHYAFRINGTSLQVNGVKQSADQWRKYKEIIEKNSDYRIHHFFNFTISKDNSNSSININDGTEPMVPMAPLPPVAPCHITFSDSLMPKLETVLLKDHLISDTLHYSFKINGSYMKVNGEKVDKEVWKKYKDFIESNSLNKVNRKFSYAILRDGDDTSINVENYVN